MTRAKEWRRFEARARVERALDRVQAAQTELGRACAELSSLCYGQPAWRRLNKLYDAVKAAWYKTAQLRHHTRIEFDRDPTPEELAAAERYAVKAAQP